MMVIPRLQKSKRSREFETYTPAQRAEVVKEYLFERKSHRQLDEDVLKLDGVQTRGWQSMGILHHLGIIGTFKGIFEGMSIDTAIEELSSRNADGEFSEIITILSMFVK